MKCIHILSFLCLLFFGTARAQISFGKIDSTLKSGKAGYRVSCKNKSVIQNQLDIRPVGFESGAKDLSFMIRGRVAKAEIDDLNGDGYPDLVLYIYSDSNGVFGTVYAFLSEANKSITPCALPDIMLDGKVNTGYKGHDQFSVMGSYLQQKFPIYKTGDEKDNPTGGTRVILYQLAKNEENAFAFNKVRFYDTQ